LGYGTIALSTGADIYLSTHKNPQTGKPYQSWKMTGLNGTVTGQRFISVDH